MVLVRTSSQPGLRLIIGLAAIVGCIYGFYIIRARQVSPENFLVPQDMRVQEFACRVIRLDDLLACLPTEMASERQADGLHFYRVEKKITGFIQVLPRLPQEVAWRAMLNSPLITPFLGDTTGMDTFTLMRTILGKRYNPTLMGLKAQIVPSWMHGQTSACILMPQGIEALCFYTARQSLGIRFLKDRVIVMTTSGPLDKTLAVGMLAAITHP